MVDPELAYHRWYLTFFSLPVLEAGSEPPIFGSWIECPTTVSPPLAITRITKIEFKLGSWGGGPQGVYSQHLMFFVQIGPIS